MSPPNDISKLFEQPLTYPDVEHRDRLCRLIGIEEQKDRLAKRLAVLLNPEGLRRWVEKFHPDATQLIDAVTRRAPLVVLCGDVGCGKTELAETIGDQVAREIDTPLVLYPLSLSTRGEGRVGEITHLLSAAFEHILKIQRGVTDPEGGARKGTILLVDEADSLAQSREAAQMHHEDRAGVNAFIRGVDRVASSGLAMAVIMCTNRPNSLDPAVSRRAADVLRFTRPEVQQRIAILKRALGQAGFSERDLRELAKLTGPRNGQGVGYTFSDLTQRLIPALILDAFPDSALNTSRAFKITREMEPTAPFREQTPTSSM